MSVEDGERRHGRKSRSLRIDGDKTPWVARSGPWADCGCGSDPGHWAQGECDGAIETDLAAPTAHADRMAHRPVRPWRARWCTRGARSWPCAAKRGQCRRGRIVPSAFAIWTGSVGSCNVRVGWACPSRQAVWSRFRRPPGRAARCGSVARPVLRGVASAGILMKPCWRSCVNANGHRKGVRNGASASRSRMPWPTVDIGKAAVPAIAVCGRMRLPCGGVLLFITYAFRLSNHNACDHAL